MGARIFVEAFGRFLSGGHYTEQDLYSVFRARSVLMGWYTPPQHGPSPISPVFWEMHEADICEQNDALRIATAQVGLEAGVPIVIVLPALIQCFDDSLRRFGAVELSGYQVTASEIGAEQESRLGHFVQMTNYFEMSEQSTEATLVAYELGEGPRSQLATKITILNTGPFRYQGTAYTPGRGAPSEMSPRPEGGRRECLKLQLPEGPDAAGWAMAAVWDALLSLSPGTTAARVSLTYSHPLKLS